MSMSIMDYLPSLSTILSIVASVGKMLILVLPLLIAVAYLTLLERKLMASMQRRSGPNMVGLFGLLQPLADGAKLLLKETVLPNAANTGLFVMSPILAFFLALCAWSVIPLTPGGVYSDISIGILFLFAVSSLGVYGVVCAGWSSNSKYALLGALRTAAQMVSYEIAIGFVLIMIFMMVGSLNMSEIVMAQGSVWFLIPLLPAFLIWLVSILAETNRAPFDLPEAEAELVAGFFTEYSAMGFALFFLGEYANMIMMSAFTCILFLGGWGFPFELGLLSDNSSLIPVLHALSFGFKTTCVLFFYIWVRSAFPRYRYDQLQYTFWKGMLPMTLGLLLFLMSVLFTFDFLPA